MKTPELPEHLNVETLRKWLDDYEATWTEQDKEYMGEFKHTPIRALVDIKDGGGIADGAIYEHAGLGFVIVPKDCKNG